MLFIAAIALILAVGIIALTLKRGSDDLPQPTDDITTLPSGVWPSDEIRQEKINQTDKGHQITAIYPIAQSSAITAYFRTFVEDSITQFKEDTAWTEGMDNAESQDTALDIAYERQKTATVDNYVFHSNSYAGGAHGLQSTKTFAFTEEGKPVGITELFTNGKDGLKTVAPYVQKELLKFDYTEREWVEEGAKADEINYQNFIVTESGITFIFDPYQVAYYAAGEQRITVPVSLFKSIANKEVFPQ